MTWLVVLTVSGSPVEVNALRPESKYVSTPDVHGLSFEAVTLRTSDEFALRGWWFPSVKDSSRGCVIVSETDAGNMSYLIPTAQFYLECGFSVLLYDYRGFGASQPFPSDSRALIYPEYLLDLDAAIDLAEFRAARPIVLVGLSMGSAVSVGVAERRNGIAAVVADGIYSSTQAVVAALRAEYGDEAVLPNGYPPAAEPRRAVATFSDTALLVLAGEEDKVTTPAMACEVFAECTSHQKSLWIAPDAVHLRIPEVMGDLYFLQIRGFLDRVLGSDGNTK